MELGWIGLGIIAFASTNVDDIFVLIGFLSQPEVRVRHVVAGQYAGLGFIIALSVAGSFAALVIPRAWVGMLGIVPIGMGLARLWIRQRARMGGLVVPRFPHLNGQPTEGTATGSEDPTRGLGIPRLSPRRGWRNAAAVALVTVSNGSDNVATYIPLFASAGPAVKEMIIILFLSMLALWCALGYWMVSHRRWGNLVRKHGEKLLPYVLILLGSLILIRTFHYG